MNMLKVLLTGIDNQTYDIVRVLALLSVVVALGITVYKCVWIGEPFDMQSYGLGLGATFASVGAALKLKADTEPQP